MIHKPPRDYAEVAAVEIVAMLLASLMDDECWELRTRQQRNAFRELAYDTMEEALSFWEGKEKGPL